MTAQQIVRNRTFDELSLGDSDCTYRTLTEQDIQLFALMSGDVNPAHLDAEYAATTAFQEVIAHGMWGGALISAVLGTRLPGPGTIYLGQDLRFKKPVKIGDTLCTRLTVSALDEKKKRVTLDCLCANQDGETVIEGTAQVLAPSKKIERPVANLPELRLLPGNNLPNLLEQAQPLGRIRVAVVHPCDSASLGGALDAYQAGFIEPVLVGPKNKLQTLANENGWNLEGLAIDDVPHSHAAADYATRLAATGKVQALMKGSLHTDELISAVLKGGGGQLRTKRRLSHCFVLQTPNYPRPFIVTDAAVNLAPNLEQKADIIRNAITLAHAIGVDCPRVAILAAVETINPAMPATLDAAALCKMADRGQIAGAVLDGPLAFDNAVSIAAAQSKGIESKVAGVADILVTPDLESGNMLAKQLMFMGGAGSAGVVLGAKVPIVLTSRADSRESRIASCALALLLANHFKNNPP